MSHFGKKIDCLLLLIPNRTISPVIEYEYDLTTGLCRGGASPANDAGSTLYQDTSCKARCNSDPTCTGFVLASSSCETYFSVGAVGNGDGGSTCQMKGWM